MKSMFRIYPLWTRTIGALALALVATPTCQASVADIYRRRTWHFKLCVILLLSLAGNFGGALNTLQAQESGWNRWVDPKENAFAMEVPQGWHVRGGAYRFGYGDVRVMVDAWSPDGKINLRYGDVWFVEPYAVPDRYHREGEQQDLGALGKGIYAAYRAGQQFAEIYARRSFSGVCGSLTLRRDEKGTASSSPGIPEPLLNPTFDGKVLTFQVSHCRAHPPRTLTDPPMNFRLTLTGTNKGEFVDKGEDSPAIQSIRSDY